MNERPRYVLEASPDRPEKASMSLLSKVDTCLASAALYLEKDSPQSAAMLRGEIFHQFVEEAVKYLIQEGEMQMPGDVAKARVMHLVQERKGTALPEFEQDSLRLMAWNWAEATIIDPDNVVGIEQMLELELGDWTVRGKLDFAQISPFGYFDIRDYKTSLAVPKHDDLEEGVKSFQGRFYAMLALFGKPEGESLGLGSGINEARVTLEFPRYVDSQTGSLVGREVIYDRSKLADFRHSVEGHLAKLDHALETGEWEATHGAHCSECPARNRCPIPDQLHDFPLALETSEEAEEAALAWHISAALNARNKSALRSWAEENGPVLYDADYKLDFRHDEKKEWKKAAEAGDGVIRLDEVPVSHATVFDKQKIKEAA